MKTSAVQKIIARATKQTPANEDPLDHFIFMLTNDNNSAGYVTAGTEEQPLNAQTAFLTQLVPADNPAAQDAFKDTIARGGEVWPPSFYDMVAANSGIVSFFVLADNLTKAQAQAGKQAVIDLLGTKKNGGWLLNE